MTPSPKFNNIEEGKSLLHNSKDEIPMTRKQIYIKHVKDQKSQLITQRRSLALLCPKVKSKVKDQEYHIIRSKSTNNIDSKNIIFEKKRSRCRVENKLFPRKERKFITNLVLKQREKYRGFRKIRMDYLNDCKKQNKLKVSY